MNFMDLFTSGILELSFVLVFLFLILLFLVISIRRPERYLRKSEAFQKLAKAIGLAVEAGQRLHISLGHGAVNGAQSASALVGLSMLQRIARSASASDLPPVVTSGDASLAILSRDSLQGVYRVIGAQDQYDPISGQLSGLTPFTYAAGVLPVIADQQVSATVLAGHFGAEVALITDASERSGGTTLAGSDSLAGQAVLYATADDILVGEELFAGGAYLQAGPAHLASVRAQDVMRWLLVGALLLGSFLKLVGAL